MTSLIASCFRILNWLYFPNCLRSILTWDMIYVMIIFRTDDRSPSLCSPSHHRSEGQSRSCRMTRSRSWGYTSACPRASCCRWCPHTKSGAENTVIQIQTLRSLIILTLWDTGTVQRILPLENSWAFVFELLGSAAKIPLDRSCLLYRATSGFQSKFGAILEQMWAFTQIYTYLGIDFT